MFPIENDHFDHDHFNHDFLADTRKLVHDIRKYLVKQPDAIEVLIFKGKSEISVSRRFALSTRFYFEFKKMFEK